MMGTFHCSCLVGCSQGTVPNAARRFITLRGVAAVRAAATAERSTAAPTYLQLVDGKFVDDRWKEGRWVLDAFKGADGKVEWDAVIDCEIERRRLLENSPIPSTNEEPVLFDTGEIPWWVWMRRFHLPEAEKLNGRAAMVGYVAALLVDQLTGTGILDQQESFLGKLVLHITVFGILLIRTNKDVDKYKNLLDEATFYDKQWNAAWVGKKRPSEGENA